MTNSTEIIALVHWEDEGFKRNINSTKLLDLLTELTPHNNRLREEDQENIKYFFLETGNNYFYTDDCNVRFHKE